MWVNALIRVILHLLTLSSFILSLGVCPYLLTELGHASTDIMFLSPRCASGGKQVITFFF